MMGHPTTEKLLNHIENKEDSGNLRGVRSHLEQCGACAHKGDELQELLQFMGNDAVNEPPSDVVQWGVSLFQPILRASKPGVASRIAKLVFDSFTRPLPVGVRHVGSVPRQLVFKAGDVDVDLRIETGPDNRITLAGQVLSESALMLENAPVRLESHGVIRYKTRTNPVGEFMFGDVPRDTYHLSLDLPEGQVTLFCVHRSEPVLA